MEISQHARDALVMLHTAGEESAIVFGSSSSAVLTLDMTKTQLEAARAVIVHDVPLPHLLAEARKWQRFFASVYLNASQPSICWMIIDRFCFAPIPLIIWIRGWIGFL